MLAERAWPHSTEQQSGWAAGGHARDPQISWRRDSRRAASRGAGSELRGGEAGLLDRSSRPHRIPNRGALTVYGYAFAGGDRHVARVDVSIHGGASGGKPISCRIWADGPGGNDGSRWTWRPASTSFSCARGTPPPPPSPRTKPHSGTPRATSTPAPGSASGGWLMKRSGLLRPLLACLSRNRRQA
jgi:hypothetical protein